MATVVKNPTTRWESHALTVAQAYYLRLFVAAKNDEKKRAARGAENIRRLVANHQWIKMRWTKVAICFVIVKQLS